MTPHRSKKSTERIRLRILVKMGETLGSRKVPTEALVRLRMHLENEHAKEQKAEDEIKNAIISTKDILSPRVKALIQGIAKEFGEKPNEFYFSYVRGKKPWWPGDATKGLKPVWDWFKQYLLEDDKFNTFFTQELGIKKLKAHREKRIKQLSQKWRERLSDGAKHVLAKLEGEFGVKFELSNRELIEAGKLGKETFRKNEQKVWLPKLRTMLVDLSAKKMISAPQKVENGEEIRQGFASPTIQKRIQVELFTAGKACWKKEQKVVGKRMRRRICTEYLKKHAIKGKPDYTFVLFERYIANMKSQF